MANPSNQKFYLNEQRISLQAYEIGGSNYVKLRDIGQAVDFSVTYNAATNTVTIHPDKPYEMEAAIPVISQTTPPRSTKTRMVPSTSRRTVRSTSHRRVT